MSPTPTIRLSSGAVLNVSAVSGGFVVGSSQTLAGVGSVSGNVTINGTVSPGILTVALKPAAAPTILPPLWDGTNLRLQLNSQAGFNYVLQATPQLTPANWTAIQTNAGGGLMTFVIPTNASTQQFFRISVQ